MAGFDYQAAASFINSSEGQRIAASWFEASEESDLQDCLNNMIPLILTSQEPPSRLTYYDTHGMLLNRGITSAALQCGWCHLGLHFCRPYHAYPEACLLCSVWCERR